MKAAKEAVAHSSGNGFVPYWWEAGLYDQGVKFDTVVIRSRTYDAFGFLEAQFGEDVHAGEARFVYCGIGPREAGWREYKVQLGRLWKAKAGTGNCVQEESDCQNGREKSEYCRSTRARENYKRRMLPKATGCDKTAKTDARKVKVRRLRKQRLAQAAVCRKTVKKREKSECCRSTRARENCMSRMLPGATKAAVCEKASCHKQLCWTTAKRREKSECCRSTRAREECKSKCCRKRLCVCNQLFIDRYMWPEGPWQRSEATVCEKIAKSEHCRE